MRVLVTGGAGFIGGNLVHALLEQHEVGVIDDLSTGSMENVHPAAWFRKLDITDDSFAEAVGEFRPEAVVHLAAQASVAVSVKDPELDWRINVDGTRAVAAAARAVGARRFILASSAAVYGEPAGLPLSETDQKHPINPYGQSKLGAEEVVAAELIGSSVDFANFRFANVFGPRQNAEGEGGVVAVFCDALSHGTTPTIYGDGKQTRDFIFVADIVNAILMALVADVALHDGRGTGPAYNISTGTRTSVDDVARLLRPLAGFYGEFTYAPERDGDIKHSVLDSGKARDVFAWDARVPLEVALAQTYRWFASSR